MTEEKKTSKKGATKKVAGRKKGVKKKTKEMTSREKILKYCQVVKEPNQLGEVLMYGKHKYRMNKPLSELTDDECDKVIKNLNEIFGFEEDIAVGNIPAKQKIIATVDPKFCECGCKGITRRGSRFLPGHDAKLKSALFKAMKKGDLEAKKELKARGWV
ncbi:MAG: hypothetical protein ACTSPV_00410 [Candidatus Hodarchaeales archaeon]